MFIEPAVLHGDDGLSHDRGDLRQGNLDAVLFVEGCDHRPVGSQDARALRQGWSGQLRGQGFIALDRGARGHADPADEGQGTQRHQPARHRADDDEQHEFDERGRHSSVSR